MDSMTMMAKRFNSTGNAETLTAEGLNTHIRKRAADIRDMAGGETEAHAYLRFVEKEAEGRELFKAAKSAPTGEAEPEPPEYDRFTGLQKRDAETVPMQALMALADDHAKANPGAHPGKSIAHAMSTTAGQALYRQHRAEVLSGR